jgi:hypothetical protein
MDTMLLDKTNWDLALTPAGDWALASSLYPRDPVSAVAYGQAQDAASQIRLFLGELLYDTTQGMPYWEQILGFLPSTQLIAAKSEQQALLVPGVIAAKCSIPSVSGRVVSAPAPATVTITNDAGQVASVSFQIGGP